MGSGCGFGFSGSGELTLALPLTAVKGVSMTSTIIVALISTTRSRG